PLHEEALHRADGKRPVDVAAPAGTLTWRRADVGAHRRDRVRFAGQDVALFEPPLRGEIQVAATVRSDRAGFLTLNVALKPGSVDRLDEEFLIGVDRHEVCVPLHCTWGMRNERLGTGGSESTPDSPNGAEPAITGRAQLSATGASSCGCPGRGPQPHAG